MTEMWINMGPQHPMAHGLWNLKIKVDGETIVDAAPEMGYLHRGMEKVGENRTYDQIVPLADRLCYASSMTWAHAYVLAAEELLEVEAPSRAKYIRVICLELQRVASHLTWLAAHCGDYGLTTMFVYAYRDRELYLELFNDICGARLTYSYPRIGGVRNDIPHNWKKRVLKVCDYMDQQVDMYETMTNESTVFLMRTQGVGRLSKGDAMNLGVTGPSLRGSNSQVDLRKTDPYEVYDQIDWDIPYGKDGDCYSRFNVRLQEIRDAGTIIRQAFKKMPKGDVYKKPRNLRAMFQRENGPSEGPRTPGAKPSCS